MSKRLFILALILLVLILTTLNATAQSDLTEIFTTADGTITVRYPADWTLDDFGEQDFALTYYENEGSEDETFYVDLFFMPPDIFVLDYPDTNPNLSALEEVITDLTTGDEKIQVERFSLRNRRAVKLILEEDESYIFVLYAIEFRDGRAGGVYVGLSGDFSQIEPLILDILATFDYAPLGASGTGRSTGTPSFGGFATSTRTPAFPSPTPNFSSNPTLAPPRPIATATLSPSPAAPTQGFGQSGAACMVSVSQARAATVRSGPSAIRPAVLFLPENRAFTVIGRTAAADGTIWYRLDKQEVAPDKSAAELWASGAQVSASGDC